MVHISPPAPLETLVFILLLRVGLLTLTFSFLAAQILAVYPITLDTSAWYSGYGFTALSLLAAIALYSFWIALGNRPLFESPTTEG